MAHVYEVSSPTHAYGTAVLSEKLQEKIDSLDITVYPASQLGNESELLEQLVAGEIDLAITGPSFLAMWHPPIGVFDAAYVSRDLDHMLENQLGEEMAPEWDELRKQYGVRMLDSWVYGSRHLTSNVPIRHPDDPARDRGRFVRHLDRGYVGVERALRGVRHERFQGT